MNARRLRGFTLIELMIVVAVAAILAAIAIPAYQRYGYRARRPDGQKLLLSIANAEERYYALQNKYADLATIGFSTTTTATSDAGYYTAVVTVGTAGGAAAQTYSAVATPAPAKAQKNDVCGALSLSNTGLKSPTTVTSNGSCW